MVHGRLTPRALDAPRPGARDQAAGVRELYDYGAVRQTLRELYLLRLAQGGRCTIERLGAIGGAPENPQWRIVEIATRAAFLADCTDDERFALEAEVVAEHLPTTTRTTAASDDGGPAPRAYRVPTTTSKCSELARETGQAWWPRKYHAAVDAGFRKVARRMVAAGAM